jgi:hypothetical protein
MRTLARLFGFGGLALVTFGAVACGGADPQTHSGSGSGSDQVFTSTSVQRGQSGTEDQQVSPAKHLGSMQPAPAFVPPKQAVQFPRTVALQRQDRITVVSHQGIAAVSSGFAGSH